MDLTVFTCLERDKLAHQATVNLIMSSHVMHKMNYMQCLMLYKSSWLLVFALDSFHVFRMTMAVTIITIQLSTPRNNLIESVAKLCRREGTGSRCRDVTVYNCFCATLNDAHSDMIDGKSDEWRLPSGRKTN